MAQGYVVVLQWYSHVKHIDELMDPGKHTGDAKSIDKLIGWNPPKIYDRNPGCFVGECVMQIEDDGSLTLVEARYDTSD